MENEYPELKHFRSELRKQDELVRLVELRLTELERQVSILNHLEDRKISGGPGK